MLEVVTAFWLSMVGTAPNGQPLLMVQKTERMESWEACYEASLEQFRLHDGTVINCVASEVLAPTPKDPIDRT